MPVALNPPLKISQQHTCVKPNFIFVCCRQLHFGHTHRLPTHTFVGALSQLTRKLLANESHTQSGSAQSFARMRSADFSYSRLFTNLFCDT